MAAKETHEVLASQVTDILALEKDLEQREAELMADDRFRNFLEFQKETTAKIGEFWKAVETEMIKNDVKSIKGEWGSLTITERLNWDVDFQELPAKFFKKVPDTKRISDTFRLEGKAPKGTTPSYSKFLTKRIK